MGHEGGNLQCEDAILRETRRTRVQGVSHMARKQKTSASRLRRKVKGSYIVVEDSGDVIGREAVG